MQDIGEGITFDLDIGQIPHSNYSWPTPYPTPPPTPKPCPPVPPNTPEPT